MSSTFATRLALALAFALAVGVPGTASGGTFREYRGNVEGDPSTDFQFDFDRVNGQKRASNFDLARIPFSCHDGTSERRDFFFPLSSLRVRDGRFEGKSQALEVEGELRSEGRARGVLSVKTSANSPEGRCYSGVLGWKAEKL